jgi:hypothetical protein
MISAAIEIAGLFGPAHSDIETDRRALKRANLASVVTAWRNSTIGLACAGCPSQQRIPSSRA